MPSAQDVQGAVKRLEEAGDDVSKLLQVRGMGRTTCTRGVWNDTWPWKRCMGSGHDDETSIEHVHVMRRNVSRVEWIEPKDPPGRGRCVEPKSCGS